MKLLHHDSVQIDIRKIRDYLLSPVHPVGRFKARVFRALGFDVAAVEAFVGSSNCLRGRRFGGGGHRVRPEVHCSGRARGPAHGLRAGDLGAVVEVYADDGVEVEFVRASGQTKALVTLKVTDLRTVAASDILSVRAS